ncbi:HDOD domain-containing protein [Solibacillus sp. FSL R7-0682]|uniref:EAL and HDOD domain-containing protein n=1 Tax=Solibacillus sp. FSL R7-0682 TaxID=2921690 RepID=UPI0030F544FA
MEIFIGRQPIFNIREEVVAYELLYRNSDANVFPQIDSDKATLHILINSFLSIGINEVANGHPAFVNFTENLVMGDSLDFLDPKKVVVELLENIPITLELIERLKELKEYGFKIALDDFIMTDDVTLYPELFTYIDYIKIDFIATSPIVRMEIEQKIKSQFPSIKLLAEKVETREEFEIAKESGYSLFQGYFFEQPEIIKSTDIPPNIVQYFQIIALLRDDEANIDIIAENIEREISLTYKLLQLINNSARRTKSKVRSIKQAILLLGLEELRKWIYLLAMRETDMQHNNDVFKELMYFTLFRAKVCEKIARLNYQTNYSEYFLVGMFSLIDSLLKRPLNLILSQLPLSEDILETIGGVKTNMTPYLQFSIALSKLDWKQLKPLAIQLNVSEEELLTIYEEVNAWVEDALLAK